MLCQVHLCWILSDFGGDAAAILMPCWERSMHHWWLHTVMKVTYQETMKVLWKPVEKHAKTLATVRSERNRAQPEWMTLVNHPPTSPNLWGPVCRQTYDRRPWNYEEHLSVLWNSWEPHLALIMSRHKQNHLDLSLTKIFHTDSEVGPQMEAGSSRLNLSSQLFSEGSGSA